MNKQILKNLRLILSSIILIICQFQAQSQFSVKILNEDFSNNMMRWDIRDDSTFKMEIVNGKYLLSNKTDGAALTSTIEVPNIQNQNFRITASLTKTKGIDNNGFGISWGGIDANNEFEFVISANGFFKVLKWENGKKEDLIGWTYQSSINKWDLGQNELKVENINNLMRFYINGTYVAALKYIKPFGQKIGFVLNETMDVVINKIIAENLTVIDKPIYSQDLINIKINKVEFTNNNSTGTLNANEDGFLNVEITNKSEKIINDLAIRILPPESSNGIIYDPITMIDAIEPGQSKFVRIQFSANEEITSQIIPLSVHLTDIENTDLDAKPLNIETKSAVAYNPDITTTTPNSKKGNSNEAINEAVGNCASGCLIGIIVALIEELFK